MHFIDSHCHLQYYPINTQIEAVIDKCKEQQVRTLVCVGTDINSSREVVKIISDEKLQENHKKIKILGSCGIHPTDVNNYPEFPENVLEEVISKAVPTGLIPFIGECGLDYFHKNTTRELQIEYFERQIMLAKKHNKILIIHIRDAFEDVKNILKNFFPLKFISHCFSGTYEDAKFFIDNGGYISFALNITYPKNATLLEALKKVPVEKMLFETDSPFLPPQKFRGKINYPYYVVEGYKFVCELLRINIEALSVRVLENFSALIS